MGALGSRFFDPGEVSSMVTQRRTGEPLDGERRRRLEEAGERLGRFADEPAEPLWIVPESVAVELDAPVRSAADPCAASAEVFDQLVATLAPWVAAARLARLETTDSFDPERHPTMLERLDASDFDAPELALIPPILVLVREIDLLRDGLESLGRLLRSGRPVQIVVLVEESASDSGALRFEPAYFGVAHREAYVHQGSTARPAELSVGFLAALDGSRPALHVIDAPSETPSGLDRAVVASARLSGRVAPIFRYEPQAGSSWARRMRFDENPAPEADWPMEPLPEGAEKYGAPDAAPFTFADAVLLETGRRAEFTPAGIDSEDFVELAAWLTLDRTEAARRLPFIWGADAGGRLLRLVISRALAEEARGRLGFWRTLEELAGVRNEHVEAAVARARAEAGEIARHETEELIEAHREELERVRQDAASEVVKRLVAGLLGLDRGAVEALAGGTAPKPDAGEPVGNGSTTDTDRESESGD
jgi:pyruvate-ferredoxin/flavodoxin oxidoreductase